MFSQKAQNNNETECYEERLYFFVFRIEDGEQSVKNITTMFLEPCVAATPPPHSIHFPLTRHHSPGDPDNKVFGRLQTTCVLSGRQHDTCNDKQSLFSFINWIQTKTLIAWKGFLYMQLKVTLKAAIPITEKCTTLNRYSTDQKKLFCGKRHLSVVPDGSNLQNHPLVLRSQSRLSDSEHPLMFLLSTIHRTFEVQWTHCNHREDSFDGRREGRIERIRHFFPFVTHELCPVNNILQAAKRDQACIRTCASKGIQNDNTGRNIFQP